MADGAAAAAAEAALVEVDAALTVCQADPNERQVFTVRERLNTLSDYAELTSKEVNDLASKFERRTMADGRIVIPAKVLKNIQVFCFWAREKTRRGSLWLLQILMQLNLFAPVSPRGFEKRQHRKHPQSSQISSVRTNGRAGNSNLLHTFPMFKASSLPPWTMWFALNPHLGPSQQ